MKRFAAFLLTLLLVFTLCSCGKKHVEEQTVPPAVEDQTDEEKQPNKPIPEVTKPEDTEKPVTDWKTAPVSASKPTEKTDDNSSSGGGQSGGGHHGGGGHHSGGEDTPTVQNLTITEEKTVTGGTYNDVIIDAAVGDGTVMLENVTIDGQLIIEGGGSNSIKVNKCNLGTVVMQKDTSGGGEAPRLELTGTAVNTVEVTKPAIIEATDAVSKVNDLSAKDDVTIKGENTEIDTVTVLETDKENVKLTVNDAAVAQVTAEAPVTIETKAAEGKTPVAAVEAKANVTVAGADTKVGTVTVPEAAQSKNVKLQVNDAKVAQVKAEAPVTIETNSAMGETPVAEVEAKANVTVTGAATNVGKVTVNTGTEDGVTLTVTDAKVKNVSAVTPVTIEANEKASKIEKVEAKANVTVASATQIGQVEAKAPVTVDGAKTKIETITVPTGVTTAPEIKVTAGSVNTVKADGKAKVSGTAANAIANVEAAAPVEVSSTAVAQVTVVNVTVNVTVTVNGNGEIEVAVDTDANVNIAAETANKVSVSTTQTVTTNITVTAGKEVQEVHVHKWVESGRTEADCTTDGYIDYKCTTCSETKRETIPAKGHVEVVIPAVEPTCTLPGSTAGKKCAVCSKAEKTVYIVEPEQISALNHDFTGSLVSDETGHWHMCPRCGETDTKVAHTYPTTSCTAAAKCTECGYQKAAGVHTWDAGKVQKAATCETAGSMLYTCNSCSDTKTEAIPALGHVYGAPDYQWNGASCTATRSCTRTECNHKETETVAGTKTVLKIPTCEEAGIESYSVAFKNAAFAPQTNQVTTEAIGHKLSEVEAKYATCAEVGNNAYWVCSECGKVFSDAEGKTATTVAAQMVDLLSHTKVHTTARAATCTEDGTKEYWTCSVCNKVFADEACTIETTAEARVLKALGHTFDREVVDNEYLKSAATCEQAAVYYKSCSCGEKGTETFTSGKALGHLYGEPTWTWTGYTSAAATFTCTREGCGHTETVNATITNEVTTTAGCETTGVRTYTATVSFGGHTYTDTTTADISATGHTVVKQNGQAATCEENGWNDYYKCSKCQKLFSDENCTIAIADLTAWKNGNGIVAALGHDWAEAWNSDAAGHWHICQRQGCNAASTKESHVPGAAATETVAQTCTVCGYELAPATGHLCVNHLTKTDAVAATCTQPGNSAYWSCTCGKYYSDANAEHEIEKDSWILPVIAHTFDQEKAEETYLKDAATCTAKAVYYKSCTCGAKGTETFEYGNALGHSFTNYVSDNNATCTADGTKTAKCDRCDITDTVADTDSRLGHSYTTKASAVKVSDATCTAKAVYKVQCDRCDEISDTVTVEVGELAPNNHTGALGEWQTDGSKHWKEYSCCGAKTDEAAHSGGTATCINKAVCSVCHAEYGELNQNNHNYGEASYVWNGDKCTATRVCTHDDSHVETETVDGVYTVQKAATYTEEGTAVYKATFTNTAFAEQTSAAVTIPATPFVVDGEKYDTFEKALAAAHQVGLQATHFADIQYQVYPTIELHGSYTVESELHLATATSIVVKNGGSLTVGSLTLDESTMEGWWLDAGTLRLEQGSSFKLGSVQYTGTDGAFVMDNANSNIELAGRAPDMKGNAYVAAFNGNITQQNSFTMDSSYAFFNEQNSVLTVKGTLTNYAYVDNRGTIVIDGGTLTNGNTIDNESGIIQNVAGSISIKNNGTLTNNEGARITGGSIDAFGSTVTNAGDIRIGDNCALVIEKGSTLTNNGTLDGGQGSEINIGDYIYAGETATVTNTVTGIDNNEAVTVPVMKAAAVFDSTFNSTKLQEALNTYDYVIPCGTETNNTVTLGDLTVPAGKLLILKETVNDGTNQYHNKFVLNGHITIEKDTAEKDPHNGNLVTVDNPDVTVNGRIDAYGFIAFDTLTIANNGYVYVENERMIVSTALTVDQGGTLEIGSGSQMYYKGETNATINGALIETIRNMNGFVNQVCSDIQGKGMTPNKTLTTLVITEDTILHGNYTVDTVIPVRIEFVNEEGENVTLTPTLRVGANSSLKFKELYTGEGGEKAQIIGYSEVKDENGYYTVSPVDVKVTEVASATDFLAALDDPEVTDITITEDITLTYADNLWNHPITKAVTVNKGVTLEVKPYTPDVDGQAEPGMKFNGLVIAANGSLELEDGVAGFNKAVLKTSTITSGENDEMWFEYRSQVNVNGGVLDARQGKLETDNTGNIDFEVGNGELKLPNTVNNYLITYTVDSKEELLAANKTDNHCNNILLKSDVVLTENYTVNKVLTVMNDEEHMYRMTVGSETTLTVPENVTFYVNGEVRVEGTLVNNGTIVGEGFIDVMGGTLNNGGTIDLAGDIGVERGATLQNYVDEKTGTITQNASITFADYWYPDGNKDCYHWDALNGDNTLNSLGNKVAVMAVAFGQNQVGAALNDNGTATGHVYDMVMACGENEESTVELNDIAVPAGKILMLKDYVDVGERTIHNTYVLSNITFSENAHLLIKGDPEIRLNGGLDMGAVWIMGNPTVYGNGFVHNKDELEAALPNGGNIYLFPFIRDDIEPVIYRYEDGHTEEVYETQYWIDTTAIATDTNLIKMSGEDPMAVFFKNGFTVAANTTLTFDGLNVVAAANSTVNGRVEAYNGALVVQGENGGATLTNNGTIQIGSEEVWGQFAIFDEDKANCIVNNGTIESYGELKFDRDPKNGHFAGNAPIEYATFRDLVCELQQGFGNMPNLQLIDFEEENEFGPVDLRWLYEIYPEDGQELERNEDYDAVGAFAWLIKNNIISNTPASGTKLNPWHYMTYNEVGELFNKFATKVLGTTTDLGITGGSDLADKNPCFGKLHEKLGGLSRAEVTTEQELREALNAPYVTEIHVTYDIVLSNNIDLQPAGEYHDQHREIFVEPNITLTVPQNIQMDIKQNVKLVVVCDNKGTSDESDDIRGMLTVKGNVNVFGDLEPDENDQSRITVAEGGKISYFGNAYFFGERLLGVAGDYMDMENLNICEDYKKLDGWDDNEKVTCLVAYGLQPEGDEDGSWWNFGRTLSYGEIKTVLTNVYRDALATSSDLPGSVSVGDGQWPKENDILSNGDVEELLSRFALVLPKQEDATDGFTVAKDDGQTITGKTFKNLVTITCDKSKTADAFGGDIRFKNCEFTQGVEVQLVGGIGYNIRLEGCTGNFTATATDMSAGGSVSFFGSNLTVNGLNITNMPDCERDDGGVNVRFDECGEGQYISTVEVVNRQDDETVFISGSDYTGKLRIGGNIDISGVTVADNSGWIELCNWHNGNDGTPESNIGLGSNDISINDDWGSHCFTGTGTIHVNGDPKANLQLTVNDRNLATPHVFGGEDSYAIFLGLADVNGVTFEVKQGDDTLTGKTVHYDDAGKPEGSEDFDGSKVEKTHLEKGDGNWINDPSNISLTVKVTDGCTVVYNKLWYNNGTNGTVVDQGQTD